MTPTGRLEPEQRQLDERELICEFVIFRQCRLRAARSTLTWQQGAAGARHLRLVRSAAAPLLIHLAGWTGVRVHADSNRQLFAAARASPGPTPACLPRLAAVSVVVTSAVDETVDFLRMKRLIFSVARCFRLRAVSVIAQIVRCIVIRNLWLLCVGCKSQLSALSRVSLYD